MTSKKFKEMVRTLSAEQIKELARLLALKARNRAPQPPPSAPAAAKKAV